NRILQLKAEGHQDEAAQLSDTKLLPVLEAYDASIRAMVAHQQQAIDRMAQAIDLQYRAGRMTLMALAAFAVALGSVLAWLLTRAIVRPLAEALLIAETVAAGDLSQEFETDRGGDFGRLLRAMGEMED